MIMPGPEADAGQLPDADEQWRVLVELVHDSAEGFATTDPDNAFFYRREARKFCSRVAPCFGGELTDRFAEAADLREKWGARLAARVRRKPR